MVSWWAHVPPGRVARVVDATAEALDRSLDPLPVEAPAAVRYRPPRDLTASTASIVTSLLAQLDQAARELFPSWLPGADGLDLVAAGRDTPDATEPATGRLDRETAARASGATVAAARALATTIAATTADFGPFLADLAGRAVSGDPPAAARQRRFLDELRAAGLARVIAASYQRTTAALLVFPPSGPSEPGPRPVASLIAAMEWLAYHGRFAVWLPWPDSAEPSLDSRHPSLNRLTSIHAGLPDAGGTTDQVGVRRRAEEPMLSYPPVSGQPHPASAAEARLERALATRVWAGGRSWNETYRSGPLASPIRVDLLWRAERCAVEIDGPEHHSPAHYEADRRRDVDLTLAGYAVLRFTNNQVLVDTADVLSKIERLLHLRRQDQQERRR
ncbi:DUF559 domain-containing protein [Pseudofrankia sp. DC12]|uniref:DUF559 domain-containing protein n=1 Tax=Pseudofrankia sp. DC12 TaxID=683315 RepID=UPI0005F7BA3C|nr:DUF559 domain-containing protein [Pseudofrankia sp. DC12]